MELMLVDDDSDDIGGDIAAAFAEVGGAAPAAPVATPTPAAAAPPAPGQAHSSDTPARDATGKFAAAQERAQRGAPAESPPPAGAPNTSELDRVPAALSPAIKAMWATMSPEVRAEFARREADFDRGRAAQETKAQLANRFEELFSSRKDRLAMAGMDSVQATQRLLAAQDILERDPKAGVLALCQAYGIHPSQLAQTAPRQQAPQQPQLPPALQALVGRVQTLEGHLTQQSRSQQAAEHQRITQSVQQFAADPKHIYFENVRGDMVALLNSGRAKDLADAYEQATWSSPEIRPLLLQAQQSQAAVGAKVSKARSAGGSVTGSPSPGSSPGQQANANASVEDDVRAAFAAHGTRA